MASFASWLLSEGACWTNSSVLVDFEPSLSYEMETWVCPPFEPGGELLHQKCVRVCVCACIMREIQYHCIGHIIHKTSSWARVIDNTILQDIVHTARLIDDANFGLYVIPVSVSCKYSPCLMRVCSLSSNTSQPSSMLFSTSNTWRNVSYWLTSSVTV